MILQLHRHHVKLLTLETKRVNPIEACAMLFGKSLENELVVEKVEVTQNRLQSTTHFEVDPEKVAVAIAEAENNDLEFVGLFHSHHAPATPSLIDRKFMRLWGDTLWLILSSTNWKLAAYYLEDGKVKEATIKVE